MMPMGLRPRPFGPGSSAITSFAFRFDMTKLQNHYLEDDIVRTIGGIKEDAKQGRISV